MRSGLCQLGLPIIGLPYHDAASVHAELKTIRAGGDAMTLVLHSGHLPLSLRFEDENPEDAQAIEIRVHPLFCPAGVSPKLGYVRRETTAAVRELVQASEFLSLALPVDPEPVAPRKGALWNAILSTDASAWSELSPVNDAAEVSGLPNLAKSLAARPRSRKPAGIHSWF